MYPEKYYENLLKKYHINKEKYKAPERKLSDHKRFLISSGLPVNIASEDGKIKAVIFINEMGDIVISYSQIDEVFEKPRSLYLLDAKDSIVHKCSVVKENK